MTIKSNQYEAHNCWDFLNCPKDRMEKCDIYKYGYGNKCWIMVDSVITGCNQSKVNCFNCPWYKKFNPK